ncbi:hypothetical protein Q7A53_00890 [Halobacillus rhizosphaerae]|uniref:hypothetical protein n=1 Tax=Halobacillus rhizosphaerae TaxID=3064889 RepID=UPI00398B5981
MKIIFLLISSLLLFPIMKTYGKDLSRRSKYLLGSAAFLSALMILLSTLSFAVWQSIVLGIAIVILSYILVRPRLIVIDIDKKGEASEEDSLITPPMKINETMKERHQVSESPDAAETTPKLAEKEPAAAVKPSLNQTVSLPSEGLNTDLEKRWQEGESEEDIEDELLKARKDLSLVPSIRAAAKEPLVNKEEWYEEELELVSNRTATVHRYQHEKDSPEIDMDEFEIPELDFEQ